MIKPKDENPTSQRCYVSSKTIGTCSTTYRFREGEHSVNTGESFIQILAWKKSSTLKSHYVTGHSVNRTYVLYNVVNSYLVWKEHPWFSNIAALNRMSCLWSYCQLNCIHIDSNGLFVLSSAFYYSHPEFSCFFNRMDVLGRS